MIARFEAERHTLAITNRPSIAKLLDGAFLPSGRRYLVTDPFERVPDHEIRDQNVQQRNHLLIFCALVFSDSIFE